MLFRSTVHLGVIQSHPGELVEIDEADVGRYEGEIEAGFLVPVDPASVDPAPLGLPEPEVLSTVGQPDPE